MHCKQTILAGIFGVTALLTSGHSQADTPALTVSGSLRMRLEGLDNPALPTTNPVQSEHNQRLSSRLMLKTDAQWEHLTATAELYDARVWLDNDDPTLTSNQVNTLEPLQLLLRYNSDSDSALKNVSVGRMVLDHGSRRLVAQGAFRNAMNAFEGITTDWQLPQWQLRAFYTRPVVRKPSVAWDIDSNRQALDHTSSALQFYGAYAQSEDQLWRLHAYWLDEADTPARTTRNRELTTLAAEWTQGLGNGFEGNIELVGQGGTARQSAAETDVDDLSVRAWMLHAALAKRLSTQQLVKAELDIASGDNNNADDVIHDFDTLFGVRRFDFGPTDVYQGMPRRNLIAAGVRVDQTLVSAMPYDVQVMVSYKGLWFHKAPAEVNPFIGHQAEIRLRTKPRASLELEWGAAVLLKGEGFRQGLYPANSLYGYLSATYFFGSPD